MPEADLALRDQVGLLYSNHHRWLYNWLRYRLGCSHWAADLAHDTYLRVIRSGRVPDNEQARPHLMQIAKGLVIDRHRRQSIEQAYLETLADYSMLQVPSPEEQALVLEVLVQIDRLLNGLKPKIRETFLLSRFDGLTYSAIAERLDISVATVRKYMLIAMQVCVAATTEDA